MSSKHPYLLENPSKNSKYIVFWVFLKGFSIQDSKLLNSYKISSTSSRLF